MADGDLAYSHVPSQGGALLCEMGGGALLYRVTRTYWRCRLEVDFEASAGHGQELADELLGYLDPPHSPPSWGGEDGVFHVRLTLSGTSLAGEWVDVVYGTNPAYGAGAYAVYADAWRRGFAGGYTLPDSSLASVPYVAGNYGGWVGYSQLTEAGSRITLVASADGRTLYGTQTGSRFAYAEGMSVSLVMERLPHHPLCTHAAQ